ncbi:MAG TPA: hypothetical protein VNI57_01490 [Candidatus Saccharimonadales bacterium]|nr:hypothetical protein [Candidatus Saccharimonadales bacterium]
MTDAALPLQEGQATWKAPNGLLEVVYRKAITAGDRMDFDLGDWIQFEGAKAVARRSDLARFLFQRLCVSYRIRESADEAWGAGVAWSTESVRQLPDVHGPSLAQLSDYLTMVISGRPVSEEASLGEG